MSRALLRAGLAWLVVALAAAPASAQPMQGPLAPPVTLPAAQAAANRAIAAGQAVAKPLRFRRVRVPAAESADWLAQWQTIGKLVPILPEEFEQRIKQLSEAAGRNGKSEKPSAAARLTRAEYFARLHNDALVDGQATLHIERESTDSAVQLPLTPLGFAVSSASWAQSDGAPAKLGLTAAGATAALIDRNEPLVLGWSLAGRRTSSDSLAFTFQLPRSPINTLTLDLPTAYAPSCAAGVAIGPLPADSDAVRRWRIELGGRTDFVVRVGPADATGKSSGLVLVRESSTYDLTSRGIEVSAKFDLETLRGSLDELEIELGPTLQAAAAREGDQPLAWSDVGVGSSLDEGEPISLEHLPRRILLKLPDSSSATRVVVVRAFAPLALGQTWRLPTIRPRGASWLEGKTTLRVAAPLIVEELSPVVVAGELSCRQIESTPLPAPAVGESFVVQNYTEDAAIDLRLARREPPVTVLSGTTLQWMPDQIAGETVLDLSLADGKRFSLACDVSPRWVIDSVVSQPPTALSDWQVRTQGGRRSVLDLTFSQALSSKRSLRVVVRGRWRRGTGEESLPLGSLPLASVPQAASSEEYLAIKSAAQSRLLTTPAERIGSIAYSSLDSAWQERLSEREPDLLVRLVGDVRDARASLEPQGPTYHAKVEIQATAGEIGVWETFTLRCEPEAGRTIDRLVACVTPSDREPLSWSLVEGAPGATLSVERLDKPPTDAGNLTGAWFALSIRPGASQPVVIRAERGRAVDSAEMRLGMIVLPEAVSQTGQLVVRTVGRSALELDNHGLTPVPIPDRDDDPAGWRRAAYRFESTVKNDAAGFGHVVLRRRGGPGEPSALVWLCEVRSRGEADGITQHWIEYWLQNSGLPQMELMLPSASRVSGLWVDDRRMPQHRESDRLTVDLPLDRRRLCVRLAIETADEPWQTVQRITPPLVRVDLPVLQTRWSLWTPRERLLVDAGDWRTAFDVGKPTWSQRLFGPFGRASIDSPFSVGDPAAWARLAQDSPNLDEKLDRVGSFLTRLHEVLPERLATPTTWTDLFAEAAGNGPKKALDLWIDWRALSAAGVHPYGYVSEAAAPTFSAGPDASPLLCGYGLVFVLHRDSVLLTSLAAVAGENNPARPVADRTDVREIRDEALGDSLWRTAVRSDCPPTLPVETWGLAPGRLDSLKPDDAGSPDASDFATLLTPNGEGWNVYRLDGFGANDDGVTIVHEPTLAGWRWSACLIAAALAACWPRRWVGAWGLLLAIAFAGALAGPIPLSSCASAAALGWAAGYLLLAPLLSGRPSPPAPVAPSRGSMRLSLGAAPAALLLASLVVVSPTSAAPDEASESPAYPVLMLVGDDDEPLPASKGGYYLIPLELRDELDRRAAELRAAPEGSLINSAVYRTSLLRSADGERYELGELTIELDIQTFADAQRVRLPLAATTGSLGGAETGVLDGRSVELLWNNQRDEASVFIQTGGAHRLTLTFTLEVDRMGGEESGAALRIPALPRSRLEVRLPVNGPTVEVDSAIGAAALDSSRRNLTAELGPTSRLALRWNEGKTAGGPMGRLKVEELLWLKVLPGSASVDVKLKCRAQEGTVRQLFFAADPRFEQVRPWSGPEMEARQSPPQAGGPRTTLIQFKRPLTGEFTLETSFILRGASGVGNVRLPLLQTIGADLQKDWLAMSVDRSLEVVQATGEEIPLANFNNAWGVAELKPPAVRVIDLQATEAPLWKLTTRPRQTVKTCTQDLTLTVGPHRLDVRYDAALDVAEAPCFQHVLSVPAELNVEDVSLIEFTAKRKLRWSRPEPGRLVVFLVAPANASQTISLTGSIPLQTPADQPLPHIRPLDATSTMAQIHVRRRPGALVEVGGLDGWESGDLPSRDDVDPQSRLVAAYRATMGPLDGLPSTAGRLRATVNEPQAAFAQVTTLARHEGKWRVTTELQVRSVSQGVLDSLTLDVPPSWPGPYEVSPPVPYETVDVPGLGRKLLILRPYQPIAGPAQISVRGPLEVAPGGRAQFPDLVLRGFRNVDRYAVLPTQSDLQAVSWETEGMQPKEIPAGFYTPLPQSYTSYKIDRKRFSAALRGADPAARAPRVWLADVRMHVEDDGRCHGVATFDVEAQAQPRCLLTCPPRCKVLLLQLDGRPARAVAEGADGWRIDLSPSQYPHYLEVVFETSASPDALRTGRGELAAPWIADLQVDRTLWTVHGLSDQGWTAPGETHVRTALGQTLQRFDGLAGLIEQARQGSADEPADDAAIWYSRWRERLDQLGQWTRMLAAVSNDRAEIDAAVLSDATRTRLEAAWATRLGPAANLAWTSTGRNRGLTAAQQWTSSLEPASGRYAAWTGGRSSIEFSEPRWSRPDDVFRLTAAAALIVVGLVLAPWLSWAAAREPSPRYLAILAMIAGVAWWRLLDPSVLGLAIALAAAVAAWWAKPGVDRSGRQPLVRRA